MANGSLPGESRRALRGGTTGAGASLQESQFCDGLG
jgi:hypothetical protein